MLKATISGIMIMFCSLLRAQNPIPELVATPEMPKAATLGSYTYQPFPSSVTPSAYYNQFNKLSTTEKNRQTIAEVDQQIAELAAHQNKVQSILDDAVHTMDDFRIDYTIRGRNISGREIFQASLSELQSMLKGDQPLSLKKAVFLSEYAYDPSLSWPEFQKSIDAMTTHIGYYMREQGHDIDDNGANNLAIYNFITDTLKVRYKGQEQITTTYPMFYDFEDFWGRQDNSKMFVSKLIKEGTGQCHSLPLLYLILAEEMDADAHLAFAPNHSYIKIQDQLGDWHNIELTTHSLTSDQFIMQTGFVKSAAIVNKIYMNPLSKQEVIAQSVNDLMMNYIRKFGYEDFILEGTAVALHYAENNITSHLINHNYYQGLFQYIVKQYKQKGLSEQQLNQDEKALYVYKQMMGSRELIDNLGYADMPKDLYESWLRSVEEEGRKQEHRNKMRTLMGQIGNN